jgi:hypothetical protein
MGAGRFPHGSRAGAAKLLTADAAGLLVARTAENASWWRRVYAFRNVQC